MHPLIWKRVWTCLSSITCQNPRLVCTYIWNCQVRIMKTFKFTQRIILQTRNDLYISMLFNFISILYLFNLLKMRFHFFHLSNNALISGLVDIVLFFQYQIRIRTYAVKQDKYVSLTILFIKHHFYLQWW